MYVICIYVSARGRVCVQCVHASIYLRVYVCVRARTLSRASEPVTHWHSSHGVWEDASDVPAPSSVGLSAWTRPAS